MYQKLTTTTTTPMSAKNRLRYRFGGIKYQFQGGGANGTSWKVDKNVGSYPFPRDDVDTEDSED